MKKDKKNSLMDFDPSRRELLEYLMKGGLATFMAGFPLRSAFGGPMLKDDVVRIGYLPITDATALLVAHANGYFEEEGLKVEKPTLMRGWAPLVESFAAGKFNLVHLLNLVPIWMRYNNKFPVKVLAWGHTNGSGIIVGNHTKIKTFADFGGKQIAVPFWYSQHNMLLQMGLKKAGITPVIKPAGSQIGPKECNLQILAPPDMPLALAAKKIDGYTVAEPFNAMGETKAGGRMFRFSGDIWQNHPCCVISTHEELTTKKPEWSQKVVNAIVRAQIYASMNKEKVATLLSKDGKGYLPMDQEIVLRSMTKYHDHKEYVESGAIQNKDWKNGRIDFQPWPYPSATRMSVEQLKQMVIAGDQAFIKDLDPEFVAKDLYEYRYVKAALEKFPDWKNDPSVNKASPFKRTEKVVL